MATTRLSPKATFVTKGYGQVEPNHLSAPRNGRVYAQLPAAATYDVLENGQFVKYDYAAGVCNTTGAGEWMMVFNEIKIYRDFETDADFAMKKGDYNARVYSPGGTGASKVVIDSKGEFTFYGSDEAGVIRTDAGGDQTLMPTNTTMVPRVIGIEVGDIWTTNTIKATEVAQGADLKIDTDGYLTVGAAADGEMKFKAVKVYTMPDNQPGVKVQRIA